MAYRITESMDFKIMIINFRKKAIVVLFLLCMKVKKRYIVISAMKSMTLCMGRTTNQRKVPKWLPYENYKSQ